MQYATRTTLKRPKMVLHFPPIYLLPTHLPLESLHALEDQIPTLTYDITEAKVVVGKVTTKQRAQFELRSRKIWTQEIVRQESEVKFDESDGRRIAQDQPRKRRRLGDRPSTIDVIVIDSSTESEEAETSWKPTERDLREELKSTQSQIQRSSLEPLITIPPAVDSQSSASTAQDSQTIQEPDDVIKVVKLSWFIDSLAADGVLPTDNYLVYEGRKIPRPNMPSEPIITKASLITIRHGPKLIPEIRPSREQLRKIYSPEPKRMPQRESLDRLQGEHIPSRPVIVNRKVRPLHVQRICFMRAHQSMTNLQSYLQSPTISTRPIRVSGQHL